MKQEDVLTRRDKLLIILALRAKLKGLELSIADYHRGLKRIFNCDFCYNAVRNRLRKLEENNFLKSELVRDFARNDLIDSKGNVKLRRHTRVYKRVYAINVRNEVLKRLILALKELSRKLFKKGLNEVVCNDGLLKSLV